MGRSNHVPLHRRSRYAKIRQLPKLAVAGIMPGMTLLEITYQLQEPLTAHQLGILGSFANTYGLRSFRVNDQNHLSFEYDASRLRETQVAHVLGQARIAITRKVN